MEKMVTKMVTGSDPVSQRSLGSSEKWGVTTHLSRKVLCSHSLPISVFPGPVLSRREADTHKRPLSKQGLPSFSTDHIK